MLDKPMPVFRRTLGIAILAWTCLLPRCEPASAQQDTSSKDTAKPVAVLSIANLDHLATNFAYLSRVTGREDIGSGLQMLARSFVEHFDRDRPAGVLITLENDEPKGVGFLPVREGDKLLDALKNRLGTDVDDLGNGIRKLAFSKSVYLKQQGPWLYFTDQPRHLARLPNDPAAMLGDLHDTYAIALRFFVSNIPQGVKDVANFTLQSKIDSDLDASTLAVPDTDKAFVKSLRTNMKKWLSAVINGADQVTVGWAVDDSQHRTYVDLRVQAKDGSALAHQFATLTNGRSTFTGFFVDDAAAAFEGSLRVSDQGKEQFSALVRYVREKVVTGIDADPNAPESLKEIATNVLNVVDRTVREGKTDVGAVLLLAPGSFKFVGGVRVADGRALAGAFERFFELAKNEPNIPEVHFYAKKLKELDLHTLLLPVDETDEDARKLLGENIDLTIATGPEQLYVALGPKSDDLLETIVERSKTIGAKRVPPIHLRVAVRPIILFLASLDRNDRPLQAAAELMERSRGGDTIRLTVEPIEHGVGCRLEIEEAVLEVLGQASKEKNKR